MGVQIITGGAAGQFGSGLGKGLNEGIDAKQAQVKADAEKQALADEYIAAMKMFIAPQVEALEGQIPAQIEPQGPLPDPGAGPLAVGVHGPPAPPAAASPAKAAAALAAVRRGAGSGGGVARARTRRRRRDRALALLVRAAQVVHG